MRKNSSVSSFIEHEEDEGYVQEGIQIKIIHRTGFEYYFSKSTLKGKGIVCKGPSSNGLYVDSRDQNLITSGIDTEMDSSAMLSSSAKTTKFPHNATVLISALQSSREYNISLNLQFKKQKFTENAIDDDWSQCPLRTELYLQIADYKFNAGGSQDYCNEYKEDIQFSKHNIWRMEILQSEVINGIHEGYRVELSSEQILLSNRLSRSPKNISSYGMLIQAMGFLDSLKMKRGLDMLFSLRFAPLNLPL
ncbi:hypothetical protein VNO78_10304 [Psophocarpus tetragonolobus]|uniref:Uncharacterized protein n=1 Tax=Psophocarpus tetragonolobus TaxID=3891 RepID=A0AAN9XM52_PSOTE